MKKKNVQTISLLIALTAAISSSSCARADVWGGSIAASILKQSLETIQTQIEGVLLATLKSAAISLLNTRVASLVGGSSVGSSQVITDWKDYLYSEPESKVSTAMDNYYSTTLRGRATTSGYVSASGQPSYESFLKNRTVNQLSNTSSNMSSTGISALSEVSTDPYTSISEGDMRTFTVMFDSGSDPYAYSLRAQSYQSAVREQERRAVEISAMSSGYKGVRDDNGNVILPGATVNQMVADTQDIGNKVIAAASNPGELVGGVISSLANKMITNLVQKGVGSVQASIQKEITNVDKQIMGQVTTVNSALGTGAKYTSEVRQQTDMNLNAASSGAAIPILE